VFLGDHWQILLLDSQVFGVPHGELSDFQLEWLEHKLAEEPERHTLLLLHHHPLPAGCSWLDQHSLRNAGALDARWRLAAGEKSAVRPYSSGTGSRLEWPAHDGDAVDLRAV
jgi:3',5'-cyclic AMP phosphodiesterase CpdA